MPRQVDNLDTLLVQSADDEVDETRVIVEHEDVQDLLLLVAPSRRVQSNF